MLRHNIIQRYRNKRIYESNAFRYTVLFYKDVNQKKIILSSFSLDKSVPNRKNYKLKPRENPDRTLI